MTGPMPPQARRRCWTTRQPACLSLLQRCRISTGSARRWVRPGTATVAALQVQLRPLLEAAAPEQLGQLAAGVDAACSSWVTTPGVALIAAAISAVWAGTVADANPASTAGCLALTAALLEAGR